MVHALSEIYRVLRTGGKLIDLRPIASGWPVEIISPVLESLAGRLDDRRKEVDDLASDQALAEAVQRGLYKKQDEVFFDFFYYWETVEGMIAYINNEWTDSANLPDDVAAEAKRLTNTTGENTKIRVRRKMMLARYEKLKINN
jgi:hypothetical protein